MQRAAAACCLGLAVLIGGLSLAAPTERPERKERKALPADKAAAVDPAPVPDVPEIVGYYSCSGRDAKGKDYSGVVCIDRQADTYFVRWNIGLGGYMGVGIRQGNDLAVGWVIGNMDARGVTLYRITPGKAGPTLAGKWLSLPGDGGMYGENLRWLKGTDKPAE